MFVRDFTGDRSAHPSGRSTRVGAVALALVLSSLGGRLPDGSIAAASAQETGRVVGEVVEVDSGRPVAQASVFIEGALRNTITDDDGRFVLTGVAPGTRAVVAERLGFATARTEVEVRAGDATPVTLRLRTEALSIPAMVVTATREARSLDEVAASIGVVGRGELEAARPSHPSDIMGQIPGVWVNTTGGEGHMTAIRQPLSTDPLYLYLEDGVPTRSTGFFNHNALYEVNVPQAERIEVMKGPANALYGSDAIGGVINVQTRAPAEDGSYEISLEGGEYGYGRILASVSDRFGAHGLRLDGNYTRTDGWRTGTAYDRFSGTLRWDHTAGGGLSFKTVAAYSAIDQNTAGSSALSRDDFEADPELNYTPISFREVTALRLSTEIEKRLGGSAVTVTPYLRSNSMDLLPNWSLTFDPAIWETENVSFGTLAKYRRDLPGVNGQLIFGADLEISPGSRFERTIAPEREGKVFEDFTPGAPIYDYDVTFRQASPYVHTEIEPLERLRLSGGLRFDVFGYDYENGLGVVQTGPHRRPADASPSFTSVSPKVGVTYGITESTSVFGAFRRGFRAPSEGQLFRQGSAENTVGLEPVKTHSFEVGLRGGIGGRFSYDVATYYMTKDDDILGFQLPDGRRENLNAGRTEHRGVEIGAGVLLAEPLTVNVAFSVAEHLYDEWSPREGVDFSGNEMEFAPNTIGNVRLTWTPVARGSVTAEWSHLGPYWMDAQNENEYEGHDLLNLRASYTLPSGPGLFLKVDNVTDELYAERASFNAFRGQELAPGLPRTFHLGVELRGGLR